MNKSQLVDAIARNAKITKVDAKKALDAFIEVTGETLRSGDKIVLVGFGSFRWLKSRNVRDAIPERGRLSGSPRGMWSNSEPVQN